jgi:serine/threonine-protein kinase RsbW
MPTVEVTFTPLPAHVRTARLVATAVARRSGVSESLMDEVRLAVGEACSRAVETHVAQCPTEPVRIALSNQEGRFEIEVVNLGKVPAAATAGQAGDGTLMPPGFSLAVIAGLADEVQISESETSTCVKMSWPLSESPARDSRTSGLPPAAGSSA